MDKLYSTKELIAELRKRQSVKVIDVKKDISYFVSVDEENIDTEIDDNGPATILIITD